jgi:Na+/H+ antiporter NhaD/arsenite permease-like protein
MMYYAITVFVVAYAFIISERFNKTTVALVGAGLMVCLPVMDSPDVFYSEDNGIDWDVIFLMLGMMMIVSILRQTGVFEYVAIWAVKRANGSPLRIMMLLMVVMAFASAILPNVVSVLLIAPVTLLVCDARCSPPTSEARRHWSATRRTSSSAPVSPCPSTPSCGTWPRSSSL